MHFFLQICLKINILIRNQAFYKGILFFILVELVAYLFLTKSFYTRYTDKSNQTYYTKLFNNETCIINSKLPIDISTSEISFHEIELKYPNLQPGGKWQPANCQVDSRIAIVVPYRNRLKHLQIFLHHMHNFLQNQFKDYGIFIIEQVTGPFNRGMLLNVGFLEVLKENYDCMILHDVDLLPENLLNVYGCSSNPRHMSVKINCFKYRLPYLQIVGGVLAVKPEQFYKVNGFSNSYWGWGGEDDDLFNRFWINDYTIDRFPINFSTYKMLQHVKEKPNKLRCALGNKWYERLSDDGLNTVSYKVVNKKYFKLYTWILVNLTYSVSNSSNAQTKRSHYKTKMNITKNMITKYAKNFQTLRKKEIMEILQTKIHTALEPLFEKINKPLPKYFRKDLCNITKPK